MALPCGVDALAYCPGGGVLAMVEGVLLDDGGGGKVEEDCHHTWLHRARRVRHSGVVGEEDRSSLVEEEDHHGVVVVVAHTQNRNVVVVEDKVHSIHLLRDWEVDRLVNTVVAVQGPSTGLRHQQYFHIPVEAVGDHRKSMLLRVMMALVLWVDRVVPDTTKNHHGYQNFLVLPRLESPSEKEDQIRCCHNAYPVWCDEPDCCKDHRDCAKDHCIPTAKDTSLHWHCCRFLRVAMEVLASLAAWTAAIYLP